MKEDEQDLLLFMLYYGNIHAQYCCLRYDYTSLRDMGEFLKIPPKRLNYICEKWANKNWYDYGTCADNGWLEPAGIIAALELEKTSGYRGVNK